MLIEDFYQLHPETWNPPVVDPAIAGKGGTERSAASANQMTVHRANVPRYRGIGPGGAGHCARLKTVQAGPTDIWLRD